jgi:hypothetical protein
MGFRGGSLIDPGTARRTTRRLLTVVVLLALALLATHAVSHWHNQSYDEDNCQICHVGQAAIPQPAPQTVMQAPTAVVRFAVGDESAPHPDFVGTPSIPRAPPA